MQPRHLVLIRRLALLGACALAAGAAGAAEAEPPRRSNSVASEDPSAARVIVKFRSGSLLARAAAATAAAGTVSPQQAALLARRLSLPLVDGPGLGPRMQALRGAGLSSSQLAARLAAMPEVEWAVPDQRRRAAAVLPNDPYLGDNQAQVTPTAGQWYLRAPTTTLVSAINAVGAWDITTGSPAVTVAVLDTGVRLDHPDLAGKLWPGYDFVDDRDTANDGDGRDADPSDPGDWTSSGECSAGEPAFASSWHGTQVAGLIGAATDNGLGIAGAARNVMLLPVRVLGRCGGWDSDILAAMRWSGGLSADPVANAHPARVINMSLGSTGSCPASYRDVIGELVAAGVVVVVAGGNDAGLAVNTPANCAGAIAVAGVRHLGSKVGYSNVGPEMAVAAPAGNCVNLTGACLYPLMTTSNSGSTSPGENIYSDSYNYSVGTSFATPLVAATAGLMLSVDPTLQPAQVKSVLQATARTFPATGADAGVVACRAPGAVEQIECYCTATTCGAGLLDAAAALARVQATAAPLPTARIVVPGDGLTVGQSVVLDASASAAQGGRTIASYEWTLVSGQGVVSLTPPTDGASVSVQALAAGTATIVLTVIDSAGASGTTSTTITVAAGNVTVEASGGGGGAFAPGWAVALAVVVLALRRTGARR
jgi:serine protease